MTTPDPVTDVWELLFTAACDYRDQDGSSEARLIDALMPVVKAYGDARVATEAQRDERVGIVVAALVARAELAEHYADHPDYDEAWRP